VGLICSMVVSLRIIQGCFELECWGSLFCFEVLGFVWSVKCFIYLFPSHFVSILDKLIWFAKTVVIEVGLHERLLVFALQSFWYCFEAYEWFDFVWPFKKRYFFVETFMGFEFFFFFCHFYSYQLLFTYCSRDFLCYGWYQFIQFCQIRDQLVLLDLKFNWWNHHCVLFNFCCSQI
jgi:hypothetical protein